MTWLKKNLIFTILMVLLAGVLAFEIYLVLGKRGTAQEAERVLRQKVEEYQRLVGQNVLPHNRNVELTSSEIERRRQELNVYTTELAGQQNWKEEFARHPTSRSDAVFDIQFFVDEYRQRARAANVSIADLDGDYFGFGAYAQTGPEESLLPSVFKQRLIVAHILDQLFEARPSAVLAIRRPGESRANPDEPNPRGQTSSSAGFRLTSQLTAAIPEVAEAMPFEVAFTGRASTLRAFLNNLAAFDMPLVVRSVQVSPASGNTTRSEQEPTGVRRRRAAATDREETAPTTGGEATEAGRDENIPLVADNLSRFTVALEFIDVIPLDNAR